MFYVMLWGALSLMKKYIIINKKYTAMNTNSLINAIEDNLKNKPKLHKLKQP